MKKSYPALSLLQHVYPEQKAAISPRFTGVMTHALNIGIKAIVEERDVHKEVKVVP